MKRDKEKHRFNSTLEKKAVLALQELSHSEISADSPVKHECQPKVDISPWAKKRIFQTLALKPKKTLGKHVRKTSENLLSKAPEPAPNSHNSVALTSQNWHNAADSKTLQVNAVPFNEFKRRLYEINNEQSPQLQPHD